MATLIAASYDYRLVALSFVIAFVTSYTALDLAARVTANHGTHRGMWLLGGALAMGTGIWCMYYHQPTVPSLLAAIAASSIALYVVSRNRITTQHLLAVVDRRLSAQQLELDRTNGRVTGIAGVGRDITERIKNEEALKAAEKKYRGIFDEALFGMFQLDRRGYLLNLNPAMAHLSLYASPEEMLKDVNEPLWSLAVQSAGHEELAAVMKNVGHVRAFELEVYRKDRSRMWISATVRARMRDGVLEGFEGMFEDITERRVLRDQLLQAQKLESVGQLAAGIAHEINTPTQYIGDNVRFLKTTFGNLTNLLNIYDGLWKETLSDTVTPALRQEMSSALRKIDVKFLTAEIPRAIDDTLEGIKRVSTLVSAMKEFSHPGTKEKVPLDLNHAIQSTITVAQNEWKYVADVETRFETTLPAVSCLPGEFNQVILNLIVNAAHAIGDRAKEGNEKKGRITVETGRCPTGVEIRIGDTGRGIPLDVREKIFDPFFTTKEIGKGTGQGLAIARSIIVDKHEGSIHFESVLGEGTTFIIRLPYQEPALSTAGLLREGTVTEVTGEA
jgi:PAS domain S-box-containing protein